MKENKTIAAISPNDLNVLSQILYFYERWILSTLAPSAKRSRIALEVQFLLVKVSLLGSAKIAVLTYEEIECINSAMRVFVQQVKEKIPQSKSRDDVIESCERLCSYMVATFTSEKQ